MMRTSKYAILILSAVAVLALAGCAGELAAATSDGTTARSGGDLSNSGPASGQLAFAAQDDGGGKGDKGKDKQDKDKKDKNKKEDDRKGGQNKMTPVPGNGRGNNEKPNKDKAFPPGQDATGWQRGRFEGAIPFALPGWEVRSGDDGLVLSGEWEDHDYVIEVSRALRVDRDSFEEWLGGQLAGLDIDEQDIEYGAAGRVQMAVARDLDLEGYDCPAARAFLWTQNPAGRNQRAVVVTVSQAEGEACDADALSAFVVELAARSMDRELPRETITPVPVGTPAVTAAPTTAPTTSPQATPTAQTGWQQGQVGPVRLPLPGGWTLTNQGNTGVAQGQFEGRPYVIQAVPYTSIEQDSLQDWVESQMDDLGLEDDAAEYITIGGLRAAVLRNLDREDDLYRCPVARAYVWLQGGDAASSGVIVTIAQMGLQPCDPAGLDRLMSELLRRAQR